MYLYAFHRAVHVGISHLLLGFLLQLWDGSSKISDLPNWDFKQGPISTSTPRQLRHTRDSTYTNYTLHVTYTNPLILRGREKNTGGTGLGEKK